MSILQLSQADHGKLVQLSRGQSLSIRLPENPTTGYRWEVDQNQLGPESSPIGLETSSFSLASGSGIGGGGERTFVFKAVDLGTTQLQLKLWQPWEGEATIIDRYHLTLQICS